MKLLAIPAFKNRHQINVYGFLCATDSVGIMDPQPEGDVRESLLGRDVVVEIGDDEPPASISAGGKSGKGRGRRATANKSK